MTKTAWVFPGQGSQVQNMGVNLQTMAIAQEKFTQAEDILGWSVLGICQGDEEILSRTLYTQPCLYTIETILVDLLKAEGKNPDLVAGHSLGEYVALYAAGVYDFATGLKLVQKRGELMDKAEGGKMVALMKFDRQTLEKVINATENVVIANDNSDGQVVISGEPNAVDFAVNEINAKLAIPLKVSGAFHSPLMAIAASEFTQILEKVTFNTANIPVLSNIDPTPTHDADTIKQRLIAQMTGGVRWREIMVELPLQGISEVIEVGPGKVLTGLLKRSIKNVNLINFDG
ncbi:MAG: ACP S-malonyltransferase [Cyanobacteria bacterium]|nr:ACP S-malonyltransferase [Cyanobacteria bacterium CG_2015-16_32_12]NCO79136.1 ACP S-malonyltransferase [Cyanobacteria bacterium CG_2015-22_32_23]NCQ05245.1 ACP S-malonyltransferase [Cyanobacteria bacterium CG_2015-09_32_10]NCQ40499.1 ACP S-malonyltransferase [Cyanobacteria bacterium CG_2015-04_32_10]NCS86032.1 ACP S-malonyltransferase [Cyanobacteria bacterium CG_2015-02_32_10]